MTTVVFRSLRKTDAAAIEALALEAWHYTYRDIFDRQFIEDFVHTNYAPAAILALLPRIDSGEMFFHVASQQRDILGFCNMAVADQAGYLLRIYLLPSRIGQGLGGKLLELGEVFIRSHQLPGYSCFVHRDNRLGTQFYLKNGFRHVAAKDRGDEWFMEKLLAG
jgi:GNAT superfamily N-acetyltransferase